MNKLTPEERLLHVLVDVGIVLESATPTYTELLSVVAQLAKSQPDREKIAEKLYKKYSNWYKTLMWDELEEGVKVLFREDADEIIKLVEK